MKSKRSEETVWTRKHYSVADINEYDLKPAQFVVEAASFLRESGVKTILDAGCGQGRNSLYLAQQGFEVISADASERALDLCGKLLRREGFTPQLVKTKLQNLVKIPAESIDAVISVTVLTHIFDAERTLKEFYRVLNPNGYLIADFANPNDSTYTDISKGEKIGENAFLEQETMVVYREREQVEKLFDQHQWKLIDLKEISFVEPPHPKSRPYDHRHNSYVVIAKKII